MNVTADADNADAKLQCSVSTSNPRYRKTASTTIKVFSKSHLLFFCGCISMHLKCIYALIRRRLTTQCYRHSFVKDLRNEMGLFYDSLEPTRGSEWYRRGNSNICCEIIVLGLQHSFIRPIAANFICMHVICICMSPQACCTDIAGVVTICSVIKLRADCLFFA